MSCREIADFILAYLNHELSAAQSREFERHLAICPACVRYIDSYNKTVQLGKAAWLETPATEPVPDALVRAILEARKAK
ncbi:MAG: zf-HC2 domain-containing protein [Planctomycetes bacterium]|nr:zf-HC2 domain-containing protein [Planctomycetota bacterium]